MAISGDYYSRFTLANRAATSHNLLETRGEDLAHTVIKTCSQETPVNPVSKAENMIEKEHCSRDTK